MNKIIISVFMTAVIFLMSSKTACATEKIADHSAQVLYASETNTEARIYELSIKNVLARYKSPFTEEAGYFVTVSIEMGLDPYMLPAIAGVESGFGQAMIDATYNPFGWGGGRIYFDNWKDAIYTVGSGLKHSYFGKGATSVHDVGPRYAGGSTTWAPKVISYMKAFQKEEAKIRRLYML